MARKIIPIDGPGNPPIGGPPGRHQVPNVKPWKLPRQKTYVFTNANIVDTENGAIIENQDLHTADGIITAIGKDLPVWAKDTIVDLKGRYICPGLIDCHVHLTAVAGEAGLGSQLSESDVAVSYFRQPFLCNQILSRGFTTVRDTGGATLALKEAIADDVFPGPRLFIANKALSQTGGHGDDRGQHDNSKCCGGSGSLSTVVDGVPACLTQAREQMRTGADFIKIMVGGGVASPADKLENTQFTADEIRAIVDVAESYGTYVTAHAYTPKAIRHAVDNGVKGIEHGNLIDADTAKYLAEKNISLTPTLVTYQAMGEDKYRDFLPPANQDKNQQVLQRGLVSLKLAHDAGVTLCHGSDLLGPLHEEQSREFGIRSQVLSNKVVLQGATVNAARMLRQDKFLGQVKVDFAADLLILDKNPLEDVSIFDDPRSNVLAVLKNGRVYKSRWGGLKEDIDRRDDVAR
ncbi:hypothetical protein VHEMI09938 [[Torrubiella] hemipterigena]|uniref:Amidohydrolase-related domain-containing protein n=1 Tax=[Torrubiella] hemipterigena TaxID=1531966 RepID=A0A0A1TQY1_9HYPO|nr:hypothetical protein VHEMI09938 [[Torrubiella] hemipterigena]